MIPQIFLITPPIADPEAFRPKLETVLSTQAIAVMLLRLAGQSAREIGALATALKTAVQEAGVAALIEAPQDLRLVARLGLDGVQINATGAALGEAISSLKPERIVGVAGLRSRHDAMETGERDIDYLMFGEPRGDGSLPPLAQTLERAQWWASIFNLPCVAYAPEMAAVAPLAATGAEFIALGEWVFDAPDPGEVIAQARRAIKAAALGSTACG